MSRLRPKMNAAEHRHRRSGDGCWISYSMRWRGSPPGRSAGPSMRRKRRPRGSSHMPQAWRSRPCQGHLRPQGLHRLRRGRRRRRALTGAGPGTGPLEEAARGIGPGTWAAAGARQGCRRVLPAPGIAEHAATRTDLQEDGKKTEASSFRKTPPGQCSCLVSFIRSRSLRRSSS